MPALAGPFMTFVAEAVFASPGGGGFLMARAVRTSDTATLFDFFAETPLKRRPASEIDFFPIYADFGPGQAGVPYRAWLERHAWRGARPVRAARGAVPAADEAPGRAGGARGARKAFRLTDFQAYLFTVIAPILTASPGVARIFAPGGKPMKAGATFRNDDLAETLEWLAEDGARLFIDGDVGQAIVTQSARARRLSHL